MGLTPTDIEAIRQEMFREDPLCEDVPMPDDEFFADWSAGELRSYLRKGVRPPASAQLMPSASYAAMRRTSSVHVEASPAAAARSSGVLPSSSRLMTQSGCRCRYHATDRRSCLTTASWIDAHDGSTTCSEEEAMSEQLVGRSLFTTLRVNPAV